MKTYFIFLLFFNYTFSAKSQDVVNLPQYPGELKAFYDYVNKNLKYPIKAKQKNIYGKVWVEFFVNPDGLIDKNAVKIVKGIDPECDQEAIRIIAESKGWIPGRRDGKASREKLVLYIPFVIEGKQVTPIK